MNNSEGVHTTLKLSKTFYTKPCTNKKIFHTSFSIALPCSVIHFVLSTPLHANASQRPIHLIQCGGALYKF